MEVKKLSNSALDRFSQCPLSFYHNYLNPERPKQEGVEQFYADFGILMHFLAEFYPRTNFYMDMEWKPERRVEGESINNIINSYGNQLMERGKPLTVDEMIAIYNEIIPMIDFPSDKHKEEYYEQGLKYIESMPDKDWSKIIGLEKYFKIDLENGTPPLTGVIDKVEKDDKGIIITDYKTSKPYSENLTKKKSQLPMYGMAAFMLFGELPYKYRYDFVRFGKVVEVEIPIERLTEVKHQIKFKFMQMRAYINQGSFPANYSDFYCRNFCGYSRLCSRFQDFNGGV